jgi:hypothetical protein
MKLPDKLPDWPIELLRIVQRSADGAAAAANRAPGRI